MGIHLPPSPIFNQLVLVIHLVDNISKIHTQFHQSKIENHQFWKWVCVSPNNNHKIWWTHNFTTNSKITLHLFKTNRNTTMNQSTMKKMLEALTQAQNAHNHDIDMMVQTLRSHCLIISDVPTHSVRAQSHAILENKIPFQHNHLNLLKLQILKMTLTVW